MRFKCGFTLVELMIAMLIFSIIAIAAGSLAVNHKVKKNAARVPHGIFECFYDNGVLTSYYNDNSTPNSEGVTTKIVDGDSCTFTPPKANYYKLQLIGAGGDGYDVPSAASYNTDAEIDQDESDSIAWSDFGNAVLPDWVIENWPRDNEGFSRVGFNLTMTSPIGAGGDASCYTDTNAEAAEECSRGQGECREEDRFAIAGAGGASGNGTSISTGISIAPNDSISYSESGDSVSFELTGNSKDESGSITLHAAGRGGDGKYENGVVIDGGQGTPSTEEKSGIFGSLNVGLTDPHRGGTCRVEGRAASNGTPADPATPGSIILDPAMFEYSRYKTNLVLTLGERGYSGMVTNYIFPSLGGRALTLTPARNSDNRTELDIFGLKARSGMQNEGGLFQTIPDEILDTWDEETSPLGYHPSNTPTSPILGNVNNTGLYSYIDDVDANIRPGRGGRGSYYYIQKLKYQSQSSIGGMDINTPIERSLMQEEEPRCFDGTEPQPTDTEGILKCGPESGSPGAVRIIW